MNKPFSDSECHRYLFEIGAVLSLLPPPPEKLLDMGCGTGWTSIFFAKRGYTVTGLDIAQDMIDTANLNKEKEQIDNVRFLSGDYEEINFDGEYGCVVFFDALHHAVNEQAAIQAAFNALRTGGVCITSEPGQGHQESAESIEHIKKYNTTEKDMPPTKIIKLGYQAGFRQFKVFPHAFDLCHFVYTQPNKMYLPYGAEEIQDSSAHDKDEIMGNLAWLASISHLNGITLMLK